MNDVSIKQLSEEEGRMLEGIMIAERLRNRKLSYSELLIESLKKLE